LEWDESGTASGYTGHRNIIIEENRIEGLIGRAVTIQSAEEVSMMNNTILGGGGKWDQGQLFVSQSKNVEMVNNTWIGDHTPDWQAISGGGEGVGGAANRVISQEA